MHRTRPSNCRTGRTYRTLPILLACLSALTLLSSASIEAVAQTAPADTRYERVAPSPDGIGKRYMGREISGVMGWEGAQWLERESRAHEERPALLLRELALAPGMTVADIGAGTGYYTWQLAKKVGPNGRVYAVDVQPQMIAMLDSQMAKRGVRNVVSVLGSETTVKLPASTWQSWSMSITNLPIPRKSSTASSAPSSRAGALSSSNIAPRIRQSRSSRCTR
jgi:hypothetical protein